ncbi:MAG: RNA methyltransferase [Bdellovibrionota bacterium]
MVAIDPSGCSVYVALIHHSMLDKNGAVVTTAVTNLDIHDIARSSRTYGVKNYFLVNPLAEQQDVVKRIIGHWQGSGGRDYNPDRSDAFERVKIVSWFQEAIREIEAIEGVRPEVLMTSARKPTGFRVQSWGDAREEIFRGGKPRLLAFGTGFGMTDELLREGDVVLDPIFPQLESGYNHLSVRSAVAIALDRLLGER